MELPNQHSLTHREGDAIQISGDYQARALKSDRAAQRFWHEAKFRLLERIALPGKQERVLDAGCGSGTISHFLSRHAGEVIGIDSNPSAINFARTSYNAPNLQSAWPLIEWLLDRFDLVAKLDEAQHVTHFTKRRLSAMCQRARWKVRQIGAFNGLAPFLAPISYRLALGLEEVEFLANRLL